MAVIYKPAVKAAKPLKVLSYGPTWSGKTLSSLYMAAGIISVKRNCSVEDAYKHILLIDTEYKRGTLYAHEGPYNHIAFSAPYDTDKLVEILNQINYDDAIDVIIIDSLTHFWTKEGGILDSKAEKDRNNPKSNPYTNWLEFTGKFNKMIDAILDSPKHIFVTARAKSDTVITKNDAGRTTIKTYGLKPELRDDIDFEFDIVFNIDKETHSLLVDKGVTGMAAVYEMATPDTGIEIYNVFNEGRVKVEPTIEEVLKRVKQIIVTSKLVPFVQLQLSGRKLDELTLEQLLELEVNIINEIKKKQIKKG